MLAYRSLVISLSAALLASTALLACGDSGGGAGGGGGDATTSTTSTTATTSGTTSSTGTTSASSTSSTSTGGMCSTGRTITGTITYAGTAGPKDILRVAAVKDGMPGIPAGFNQYAAPTFPLQYEITSLPVDMTAGFTNYGIIAYLDIGGDSFMGPGPGDPSGMSMMLVKVTTCDGATLDIDLPAPN